LSALRITEDSPAAPTVSAADVFTTLSQELERMRVLGLRVEQTICAIAVSSSIDTALIAELQQLDAILQHMAALRDFSEQVALECDDGVLVDVSDALDRVTLADVRTRLARGDQDSTDEGWEIL
jgi:hypothetical protein